MARKPPPARSIPSPVPAALERLAKLSGTATSPDRMAREAQKIVADWQADPDLPADTLATRLEEMRENLAAGLASAEEQGGDVDGSDKAAVRQATATIQGLKAALDAFT